MLILTSLQSDFSSSADFEPPFTDGLEYLNFFRDGAGVVARNLAPGKAPAVLTGAPSYGTGYVHLTSQSSFLETNVADLEEYTLIHAGRSVGVTATSSTRPIFVGGYGATTLEYGASSLFVNSQTAMRSVATFDNGGVATLISTDNVETHSSWGFRVSRYDGDKVMYDNKTLAVHTEIADSGYPRAVSANKYRIGSGYASSFQGQSDAIFAAIVSRSITDTELDQIYKIAQAAAAMDSISI